MEYTAGTPNGHKISCTLEELGVPYHAQKIDIAKNVQKEEWFLKINRMVDTPSVPTPICSANGRIPAIVDNTSSPPRRLFEGQAIQLYLCEQHDKEHRISFPYGSDDYWEMVYWMTWMQSGIGPMQGQANHFYRYAPEKIQYAINRYQVETKRLYQVLNDRLATQKAAGQGLWIVGGKFTVADISCFSWVNWAEWAGVETKPFPELQLWLETIQQRPAMEKGVNVPDVFEMKKAMKSKEGEEQFAKHHSSWVMQGMKEDEAKHNNR
ncbi:hypothetical protein D0869_11815 [Hortaea werneckii]|uniref:Glutathione S-transferase GstA n=1 Tax=Hortaea werneckii TaxID=91943 RepID=A0A3M6W9P5_HORWE|nr:hypothetical protein D0869_11815 [Hortaea werneckii]